MNREKVWEDFISLPAEVQQQVADYIAFLRTRYKQRPSRQKAGLRDLADEPFIGMWRDRGDMEDSTRWVRELRQREWM